MVLFHNTPCQCQHFFRRAGVQRCRMFVQQQHLRCVVGGHQQGQCLPLPAGQQSDRLAHPVFQAHTQQAEPVTEGFLVCG